MLKEHGFVQGLSNPSLSVHVERDIRLYVHGDDYMADMPTHEEKWFASVLSRNTMHCARGSSIRMATLRWKFRS